MKVRIRKMSNVVKSQRSEQRASSAVGTGSARVDLDALNEKRLPKKPGREAPRSEAAGFFLGAGRRRLALCTLHSLCVRATHDAPLESHSRSWLQPFALALHSTASYSTATCAAASAAGPRCELRATLRLSLAARRASRSASPPGHLQRR